MQGFRKLTPLVSERLFDHSYDHPITKSEAFSETTPGTKIPVPSCRKGSVAAVFKRPPTTVSANLLPYWMSHEYGRSKVWPLRLVIRDITASIVLSWIIGSLSLGERSHHVVRKPKQPYGEIHRVRN